MKWIEKLTDKEKILYVLCCRSCQLDMSGFDYITRSKSISRQLKLSQYKVMKNLKELEKDTDEVKIVEALMKEYAGDKDEIARHTHEYLEKLIAEGLVV